MTRGPEGQAWGFGSVSVQTAHAAETVDLPLSGTAGGGCPTMSIFISS